MPAFPIYRRNPREPLLPESDGGRLAAASPELETSLQNEGKRFRSGIEASVRFDSPMEVNYVR